MIAFTKIFPTRTGLDVLEPVDNSPRVAELLWKSDVIPATPRQVVAAYQAVVGRTPCPDEYLAAEQFLLSFGWLR